MTTTLAEIPLTHSDITALKRELATKYHGPKAEHCAFEYFVHMIKPEWGWPLPWFHQRVCKVIESWWRSPREYNLSLQMPPGHAKSWYTKLFVCWAIGLDPHLATAYIGHTAEIAETHLADIRIILESEEYRELFPRSALDPEGPKSKRAAEKETNNKKLLKIPRHTGVIQATGIGGPLTGKRLNLGVTDDPIKDPEEARSAAIKRRNWDWYTQVLKTRKKAGVPYKLLMLLTRWDIEDLMGMVIEAEGTDWKNEIGAWRVVTFPAIKEGSPTKFDPREPGEALWPDSFPIPNLMQIKRVNAVSFESMYQQHPVPPGGLLFQQDWVHYVDTIPKGGVFYQSWDFRGGGEKDKGSFAVGELWYYKPDTMVSYLVDVIRHRWSPNETLEGFVEAQTQKYWMDASVKLVEKKADGVAVLSVLNNTVSGMVDVKPTTDKETRARAVVGYWSQGKVALLRRPWNNDFVVELLAFPGGGRDDQVDAMSQYLTYVHSEAAKARKPNNYAAYARR